MLPKVRETLPPRWCSIVVSEILPGQSVRLLTNPIENTMPTPFLLRIVPFCIALTLVARTTNAADWTQFRGPNGAGISAELNVPLTWSDTENLRWKVELPGPGSSSPIVIGDRIFVTCYSGYGVPKASGGDIKSLQRHLVCVSRSDGMIQWTKAVPGELPEDGYQGYISEHGYASSTPVTDGERVYCFFGKCGVVAFDLDGKQLWQIGVGKESGNRRWGSDASLILYKDSVIVNASEESQSVSTAATEVIESLKAQSNDPPPKRKFSPPAAKIGDVTFEEPPLTKE